MNNEAKFLIMTLVGICVSLAFSLRIETKDDQRIIDQVIDMRQELELWKDAATIRENMLESVVGQHNQIVDRMEKRIKRLQTERYRLQEQNESLIQRENEREDPGFCLTDSYEINLVDCVDR